MILNVLNNLSENCRTYLEKSSPLSLNVLDSDSNGEPETSVHKTKNGLGVPQEIISQSGFHKLARGRSWFATSWQELKVTVHLGKPGKQTRQNRPFNRHPQIYSTPWYPSCNNYDSPYKNWSKFRPHTRSCWKPFKISLPIYDGLSGRMELFEDLFSTILKVYP